jgi:uncharacterized protein (TIGR03492 family)
MSRKPPRVLFVSNGHGEAAIVERIARELPAVTSATFEHLPLVGLGGEGKVLPLVGPRATMPSGGLVAMGNIRAFVRDLGAGFLRLFVDQVRFLRGEGSGYACVVAVGDVYALIMSLLSKRPTVFVGTAKSAYVAGYGKVERVFLRRAKHVFVRDEPTAVVLRALRVDAQAPGNVIVDLLDNDPPARTGEWVGVLPGSRAGAYEDGKHLARVVRACQAKALFSVAPGLDAQRFEEVLVADGWSVAPSSGDVQSPFELRDGNGAQLVAWHGALGALLRASRLVLGQAGTANEAAAACGVPVVVPTTDEKGWYRMRQQRLLGDAIISVSREPAVAAAELRALLDDRERLERMGNIGRDRMGKPGGAKAIAMAIGEVCA